MTIQEKLLLVQSELKAPKDLRNDFGKYNYRSAESILESLKPLLEKQRCTLTLSDDLVNLGDRYYVKATATFSDGKETVIVTSFAREELDKKGMDGSQITGASSSYARKYALNGLLLIDDTKDSDATNTHGKEEAKVPVIAKVVSKVEPKKILTTDQKKALEAFKSLDQARVYGHLIKEHKLTYSDLESFVQGEKLEKVREIYSELFLKN